MADVSPEVLGKLAELINAAGGGSAPHGSPLMDYLKVAAELLNAVAWPIAAVYRVLLFPSAIDANFLARRQPREGFRGGDIPQNTDTRR